MHRFKSRLISGTKERDLSGGEFMESQGDTIYKTVYR